MRRRQPVKTVFGLYQKRGRSSQDHPQKPIRKGDHVVVDCDVWLRYGMENELQGTAIKIYNFKKADVEKILKCFRERRWLKNTTENNIEEMLKVVLRMYGEVNEKTVQ